MLPKRCTKYINNTKTTPFQTLKKKLNLVLEVIICQKRKNAKKYE